MEMNYRIAVRECIANVRASVKYDMSEGERRDEMISALQALTLITENRLQEYYDLDKVRYPQSKETDIKWYNEFRSLAIDFSAWLIDINLKNRGKEIRRFVSGILDKFIADRRKYIRSIEIFVKPEKHKAGIKMEKSYPININKYVTEKGKIDYVKVAKDIISTIDKENIRNFLYTVLDEFYSRSKADNKSQFEYVFGVNYCLFVFEEADKTPMGEDVRKDIKRQVSQILQPKIKKIQSQYQHNKARATRVAKRKAKKVEKNNK